MCSAEGQANGEATPDGVHYKRSAGGISRSESPVGMRSINSLRAHQFKRPVVWLAFLMGETPESHY